MIRRTVKEIGRMAIGIRWDERFAGIEVQGVSIDSRTVSPGQLFVPIVRIDDGHRYVREAIEKGAAASLWQQDHPDPPEGVPVIFVEDTLKSLQELAAQYRSELPVKVIAVTGSNGKTSTKDMLNSIFSTAYQVHKTKGNLNSQIGVPLTLLEVDESDEFAIIEMGMSERRQIERLSTLAQPDAAIITMIGLSHLTQLGSREEIAKAKLEIVAGLKPGGALIINGDEPLLTDSDVVKHPDARHRIVRFGKNATNDYIAAGEEQTELGLVFRLHGYPERISLPLLGTHHIGNALAAIAAAEWFGVRRERIAQGLRQASLTPMRMERLRTRSGYSIINDAWNASPVSMQAAIRSLADLTGYRRKLLVLGDMLELGEREEQFHLELGQSIPPDKIDYVFTLGPLGKLIAKGAEPSFPAGRVKAFEHKEQLAQELKRTAVKSEDIILIKGSRGMRMEELVELLD